MQTSRRRILLAGIGAALALALIATPFHFRGIASLGSNPAFLVAVGIAGVLSALVAVLTLMQRERPPQETRDPRLTPDASPPVEAPAPSASRELPRLVPDLVGRDDVRRDLVAALDSSGAVGITGLTGQGGIGKTQLALQVIKDLQLPPGVPTPMIDLEGTSRTPLAPDEALRRLLNQLDRALDTSKLSLPELQHEWRRRLAGSGPSSSWTMRPTDRK